MRPRKENVRHVRKMWWKGKLKPMWQVLRASAEKFTLAEDTVSFADFQKCSMPIDVEICMRRIWWRVLRRKAGGRPITLIHDYDRKVVEVTING